MEGNWYGTRKEARAEVARQMEDALKRAQDEMAEAFLKDGAEERRPERNRWLAPGEVATMTYQRGGTIAELRWAYHYEMVGNAWECRLQCVKTLYEGEDAYLEDRPESEMEDARHEAGWRWEYVPDSMAWVYGGSGWHVYEY